MILPSVLISIALSFVFFPFVLRIIGRVIGWYIRRLSRQRRQDLLQRVAKEEEAYTSKEQQESPTEDEDWEKVDSQRTGVATNGGKAEKEWKGVVGFFHPFCNAGGGGERVLWAAIRATQKRWPGAVCVVYTGDHDASKDEMLKKVQTRFNISLYPPTVHFLYLTTRRYVLSTTYPHFTLLGQSLGSLILAFDAFSLLVPDIFIDTMGYAFALGLTKFLFPSVPTAAYVHYPTISTDMLSSLDSDSEAQGINAGAGKGLRGTMKKNYWHLFARLYGWVGSDIDVVMTNSSWTASHIRSLWGPRREKRGKKDDVRVVFPPCAVEEMEREIEVSETSEQKRGRYLLYIAQFRPEKNHSLIIQAFADLLNCRISEDGVALGCGEGERPKLILVGSVRDSDDATRVYELRLLARELQVKDDVEFVCDATWPQVLEWLRNASIGVNGMWNEHFGIGVVEYQAAGLISVVNDSGGPKRDIVVDIDGEPTGYHATTAAEYSAAFAKALQLGPEETLAMRLRARKSAKRFTEEVFEEKWVEETARLVALQERH
ncbi:glycosyl transferase group 1 [Rhizodiscina lignyota]|uniref:GDP-Man:Man(3)GlcNAc(2)-PP-Dol alpha-1,2-mannosyltransferase n=1 Tax=Rhizodiscina lignyota TaxID=1504668 RepID=A0A9P4IJA9_9PEZI|nr:glycosyl transferase group 1 [Rhizodiscina lignyota]